MLKQNTEPDSAAPPPVIASQTTQPPGTDASVLCYTRPVEMAGIRTITRKIKSELIGDATTELPRSVLFDLVKIITKNIILSFYLLH